MKTPRIAVLSAPLIFLALNVAAGAPALSIPPLDRDLTPHSAKPEHLIWAERLVSELVPSRNAYNWSPTYVVWTEDGKGEARNRSVCSSFVSHDLERAYKFDTTELRRRFGLANPQAKDYYNTIEARRGFEVIEHVTDIEPGDILAVKYPAGSHPTGHVMIVDSAPVEHAASKPKERGTTQYEVAVIDSSHSFHGFDDSRYEADRKGGGVGRGTMRIYAEADGTIAGYAWSTRKVSRYFEQSQRTMIVGRFQVDYTGPAAPDVTEDTSDQSSDSTE